MFRLSYVIRRIVVVSDKFDGATKLQQHRMIHGLLKHELENGVHALALQTIPASKWKDPNPPVPKESPQCLGGMKREQKERESNKE